MVELDNLKHFTIFLYLDEKGQKSTVTGEIVYADNEIDDNIYTIISANSPRGLPHSCVGKGLKVIHDPHPAGGGVSKEDRTYIFFIKIDPSN